MTVTPAKRLLTAFAFTAIAGLSLILGLALSGGSALSQPMKCSGEEKTCATACTKTARSAVNTCLTRCGTSKAYCLKTGCWVNGAQKYCGLLKQ